jgi:hypothetical protein
MSAVPNFSPQLREAGGSIIAGSYVSKTMAQLKVLTNRRGPLSSKNLAVIEMNVETLIASTGSGVQVIHKTVQHAESYLNAGSDTFVATGWKLIKGRDELSSLRIIETLVMRALVRV